MIWFRFVRLALVALPRNYPRLQQQPLSFPLCVPSIIHICRYYYLPHHLGYPNLLVSRPPYPIQFTSLSFLRPGALSWWSSHVPTRTLQTTIKKGEILKFLIIIIIIRERQAAGPIVHTQQLYLLLSLSLLVGAGSLSAYPNFHQDHSNNGIK